MERELDQSTPSTASCSSTDATRPRMVEQPDRTQIVSRVGLSRGVAFALVTLFVVAVLFNYPWELVQAPLYVGMDSFSATGWHCFKASLGDGLLVLLIFAGGWAVRQRSDWFVHPGVRGYVVMLATGLIIGISVEWVAVHVMGRWVYTAQMPLVPGLSIGIVPILQMLVLPPLIFRVATVWRRYLSSGGL